MKKALKITLIVISSILVLVLGFISVYFLWPFNRKFYDIATAEFDIPGLDTEFVPQGMSQLDGTNDYLISGYMNDGSPSRIYQIDGNTKETKKYITLKYDEGEDYIGHAGGIVSYGSSIWVVGDGNCYRFTLAEFNRKENAESLFVNGYFETQNGADFVFVNKGILWIGEFYKENDYETNAKHHLVTRSGETNRAVAYGFTVDESKVLGIYEIFPTMALSLPDMIQGMAITSENKFVLSSSYSLPNSNIYYYKNVFEEEKHGEIRYGKKTVDLWYLDNEAKISAIEIPEMAEEIIIKNNYVYILFESACKKYKTFTKDNIKQVYSIPVSALEV